MMELAGLAGVSALAAAAATVLGAIFLGLFFSRGEPWGTLNDIASIVLMLGMIPVAMFVADVTAAAATNGVAWTIAVVGITGMLAVTVAQGLLVARVRSYEALLPWTLGAGAIVGVWYGLVGITGLGAGFPIALAGAAIASGLGFIATGYGFWRGNQRHPLSIVGGIALVVGSTVFLTWIGIAAIAAYGLTR